VLRAVQTVVDEGLAHPILIGRPEIITTRITKAGLRLQAGVDFQICDPEDDPRFRRYWEAYHRLMGRNGVTPETAKKSSAPLEHPDCHDAGQNGGCRCHAVWFGGTF
jgi:Phosphotransacetylase